LLTKENLLNKSRERENVATAPWRRLLAENQTQARFERTPPLKNEFKFLSQMQSPNLRFRNGFAFALGVACQRQALPARAGFGGESHQTPNPPLGLNPESVGNGPHLSGARGVGRRFGHFYIFARCETE